MKNRTLIVAALVMVLLCVGLIFLVLRHENAGGGSPGQSQTNQAQRRRAPQQFAAERIHGRNIQRGQQRDFSVQRMRNQQPFAYPIQQRRARFRVQQFRQFLHRRKRFARDRLAVLQQIDRQFV